MSASDPDQQTALFGTYDGHGERGELLAEYTMNAVFDKLHLHLRNCNCNNDEVNGNGNLGDNAYYDGNGNGNGAVDANANENVDVEKAFEKVFYEIDNEIKNHAHLSPLNSGSTACVVLLQGKRLWVANVGDSRAVLGRRRSDAAADVDVDGGVAGDGDGGVDVDADSIVSTLTAIDLSKDQNAHDLEERERILKAGGFITIPQEAELPARIWLDEKCSQIGLAMSRSIGDHALKDVGVIADPVVTSYELENDDEVSCFSVCSSVRVFVVCCLSQHINLTHVPSEPTPRKFIIHQFFIIATDGVWEFVSSSEAVEIVDKCFQEGMGASDACKELIRVAMGKWKEMEGDYRDDITAIIVRLDGIFDDHEASKDDN